MVLLFRGYSRAEENDKAKLADRTVIDYSKIP
jgi:hypothetical protein